MSGYYNIQIHVLIRSFRERESGGNEDDDDDGEDNDQQFY